MGTENRFESAVDVVNRAALGHVTWVSAATSINDLIRTGGHSLTYFGANPATRIPTIHLSRFFVGAEHRPDLERSYYRDYFRRDEAVPRLVGIRDRELVYKSDIYSDQEKKTSVAYNEFRRVNKTENGLFMGIGGIDGCGLIMSFANSTEGNGWTGDQLGTIRRLAPHMRQFARVRRALADARASSASLVDLLENRRLGLIQLDRSGCVLEANDRARDILLECDGLHDRGGTLAAGHRWENAELQSLLARALPPWGAQGVGGSMKITRGAARGPLVLEIHPTRRTDAAWRLGALVLIVDPVDRLKVAPDLVTRLLGLTPTESRVAVAVAAGQTVVGTSRELGCAESTVQTHLKRVYRKLGIHKQTELVRSVVSLEALG